MRLARSTCCKCRGIGGSLSAFVAVIVVSLVAISGLVVDGGAYLAARRSAINDAEQAARQGADQISQQSVRSGIVAISPSSAVFAAESYLVQTGHPGTAWVTGGTVYVSLTYKEPTILLGIVGIHDFLVRATASATEVHGVVSADP